ncbi:hypothetical protein [Kocuria tytonis]|uniref:hypothetical protein n=1 Tax=Kocuria tytonis TaxID=2054280 RepID=UPI001F344F04|nr:hypothetical protein [Kocuria tytonis]
MAKRKAQAPHHGVALGSHYWFRSLARGPRGEGLVLTYDGTLNVIDQDTGAVTAKIDVVQPRQEKADWQQPGPAGPWRWPGTRST